jgi:predicted anti-sigma-YlaC factor YlaD
MNAKMYLPGLAAGFLVSILLWFPLSATLLADWPRSSAGLVWVLGFLAGIILCASGAVAARLSGAASRRGASMAGAVCGLVAALLAFILVGSAAAGVWGARPLLDFGLKRASGEAQSIQLLLDSLTSVHWWTMLALWASMIAGLALGGLGGFLAGPGGLPDPEMNLIYQVVAVSGVLTAGLCLVTFTAIQLPLVQSSTESIVRLGLTPRYPLETVLAFPVISIFLMLSASQWLWWHFYRRGLAAGQPMDAQVRLSAVVLFMMPLLSLALIFLLQPGPLFYSLYLPLALLATLCGAAILLDVWKNSTSAWLNQLSRHTALVSAGLGILVISAGAYLSALAAGLADFTLLTRMIVPLNLGIEQAPDLTGIAQLVSDHYAVYRNTGLLILLVIVPLLTALLGALVLLMLRFASRRGPTAQPGAA